MENRFTGNSCPKCACPLTHTPYDQKDGWCDRCWMTFTEYKGKLIPLWDAYMAEKGKKRKSG